MRTTLQTAAALSLLFLCPRGWAGDAQEARAELDRAIKAMGGKEKLTRYRAATWKSKGKAHDDEQVIDFTDEWSVQGQAQYRWAVEATFMGRTRSLLLVLDRGKGWAKQSDADRVEDLQKRDKDVLTFLQNELTTVRLAQTLTPLTDKSYTLSHLGELKIQDREAIGIKATHKGQPDIDLFFDKKTHLPMRTEVRLKEPGGNEVVHAVYYDKYEETDGVKHFTRVELRRDDKVTLELDLSDFQLQEQLGDETFARP